MVLAAEYPVFLVGAGRDRCSWHSRHGAGSRADTTSSRSSRPSRCSCWAISGLLISNFPYLVPPSLTIWQTAAAPATQIFMLMGTLVMLPIILGYMIFVYWIFGGKLREGEGYH